MIIRDMTVDDVQYVADIEKKLFSDPWSREAFEDALENRSQKFFVACEEENVVGFCGFMHVADEGEIVNIGVAPEHQRQGIARRMMEHMLEFGRNLEVRTCYLEVRDSNTPARELYNRLGFKIIGRRNDYYLNPREDAIIMETSIE